MSKRILAVILALAAMTSLLTACSKDENADPLLEEDKEFLVESIRMLESDVDSAYLRIEELETMLKGVQGETVKKAAITEFSDGTGRETMNSFDSIVTLPVPFEYPNSVQSYNTSAVSVSESVNIKPSSNWMVNLSGTEVQLEHTSSKISGVIKVGAIDRLAERVQVAALTEHMNTFFSNLPPENITYKRLYVNANWMGMDASSHTFIDEEDAQLRCGMLGYGDLCVTYMFAYKGEADSSKDELILTLLQTMKIMNQELRVE